MRIAVDISLYPLSDNFMEPIKDIIGRLASHADIEVITNPMSTQIRGEYDVVMQVLQEEIKTSFEHLPKAVFAIKVLNNPVSDG